MIQKFVPIVPDSRIKLWETFNEDIRLEWLGDAFRKAGITAAWEEILILDTNFRPGHVGNKIEAIPKKKTGRTKVMVQPADEAAAKEILQRLLSV